ncbi:hypothetical protein QYF61_009557, partial [Mycteria americana]
MVEATTRWLETYPVPLAPAWNTILALEKQVLWRHGTPERIESDNETHFQTNLIDTWAKEHGIEYIVSPIPLGREGNTDFDIYTVRHSSTMSETDRLSQLGSAAALQYHCQSLRAGTVLACASVQLTANRLHRGFRLRWKQWGCAAVQRQLYHTQPKRTKEELPGTAAPLSLSPWFPPPRSDVCVTQQHSEYPSRTAYGQRQCRFKDFWVKSSGNDDRLVDRPSHIIK